jgi:hypothetical protein
MVKSSICILYTKSEQKKVKVPIIKEDLPLSRIEIKLICSTDLPKWQKKEVTLSAEKLKEKDLIWHG